MTSNDEPGCEETTPSDRRYAGVPTPDGLLVYDTEREAAWIEADTALDVTEVR